MQKFINTIIHGDCIEEMKKFPDNSVDLIFADPPIYKEPTALKLFQLMITGINLKATKIMTILLKIGLGSVKEF